MHGMDSRLLDVFSLRFGREELNLLSSRCRKVSMSFQSETVTRPRSMLGRLRCKASVDSLAEF